MKKSSIILSLLTLTLALATLPAVAEVVYSGLDSLKHLERIPVTTDGSNGTAKLSVPINDATVGNLLDGNKSTSWQSWTQRQKAETLIGERENYSADYTIPNTSIANQNILTLESELNSDGTQNYYVTTKPTNRGKFKVLTGLNFKNNPAPNGMSFDINIQGSKSGHVRILAGNDTENTIATDTNSVDLEVSSTNETKTVKLPPFTSHADAGSDYIWIDASDYDGDLTVSSISNFYVGTTHVSVLEKNSYNFSDGTSNYDMSGNNLYNLSFVNGALQVKRSSTDSGLGSFYVHRSLDYTDSGVGSPTKFTISLSGSQPGTVKVIINDSNNLTQEQELNLTGGTDQFDVSFETSQFRRDAPIKIDASNYYGDITVNQISSMTFATSHIAQLDIVSYPEANKSLSDYQISGQNNTVSIVGDLKADYNGPIDYTPVVFHFPLIKFSKQLVQNAKYKVVMRARADRENASITFTLNNTGHNSTSVPTEWTIISSKVMDWGIDSWVRDNDWISIWTSDTPSLGKLDIDWFEIYEISNAVDEYENTEETQTLIGSKEEFNWTSIPNTHKIENYSPNVSIDASGDGDNGIVTFSDYGNYRQFFILTDVPVQKDSTYRVELEVKGSVAGSAPLAFTNPSNYAMSSSVNEKDGQGYDTDWKVLTYNFDNVNEVFNENESEKDVNITFQVGNSKSNLQFRNIRVLKIPKVIKTVTDNVDLSKDWPFSPGTITVSDGVATIKSVIVTNDKGENEQQNGQVALYRGNFKKGKTYTFKAKMKCSGRDLDLTKYDQWCRLKWGWSDELVGYFDKIVRADFEDWTEVSMTFGPLKEDKNDTFINFFSYGWIGDCELYLNEVKIESTTEDDENQYCDFTNLSSKDEAYAELDNSDTSFELIDNEQVLYAECNNKSIKGLINLELDPRKNYRVNVRIKGSAAGDFNILLGDSTYFHRVTKPVTTEWSTISADYYGVNSAGKSFCVLQPGSSMTANVDVAWVEIQEIQPAVTDNSEMGFDYFDIRLPETIRKGDVYYVNVRRAATGAPSGSHPIRFRAEVLDDAGNSKKEGEYTVGGFTFNPKSLHKENAYDKNVAASQFVRVEVSNDPPENAKTIRLYCTGNVANHSVIMQTKDVSNNVTNISVPALEFTELAIYKLTNWKYVDAKSNATWVMPMISRFQIEANKIRANYPGESLKDAEDGFKKSRYTSTGGNLFDSNPGTVWNLKANGQPQGASICLDIMLPEMQTVSSGKKSIPTVINEYNTTNTRDLYKNGNLNLVVQFSRPRNLNQSFPSEIRYCGSTADNPEGFTPNESDWKTLTLPLPDAEGDVLYSIEVNPSWKRVRIESPECITQNQNISTDKDFYLSEIRAYLEFPKIDLESFDYDVLYNDRYFDYEKSDRGNSIKDLKLKDFKWEHKTGITDDINNPRVDGNNKWVDEWTNDFIDKLNGFSIGNSSIPLGKFDYVTKDNPDDSDGISDSKIPENFRRQRTYVVTHDVYTLPGKRVDLYPYSDIHSTNYYEDQFVRWYNYLTDGTPDNLYFFTDPKSVIKTSTNKGFYGSSVLLDAINRGPGTVGSVYFGKKDGTYDYTIEDQWIAADFTICLVDSNFRDYTNPNMSNLQKRFLDKDNEGKIKKSIKEPSITFRHLFHIKDGKKFAEEFSGSYDNNIAYNRKNRKYISARANADFTIRLENAMPLGSEYSEKDGGDNSTKSSYFYKRTNNGQTEYVRVCSYDIVAYKADDGDFTTLMKNIYTGNYKEKGVEGMFVPYDRSFYINAGSIISSTLEDMDEGVNWVPNNRGFARAIYCPKEKATKGKYLVRLYGLDKGKNIITIDGSGNKPLIVAEYEVTFLPEEMASFVPEHRLKKLKPSDMLYSHTEEYLEATYNTSDKARKAVNFDKYSLYNLKNAKDESGTRLFSDTDLTKIVYSQAPKQLSVTTGEYTGGASDEFEEVKVDGEQQGNYLKIPLEWTVSNYGFGYDKTGDYNIYRLADHSSATVYNSAATRREASTNPVDSTVNATSPQRGVYDRLFYNTNGGQKGMFYYVNAASDPGDIVEIKIDDPCPGATLYVSGWVNEFNDHQRETANIIVNYYANITEDRNADGTAKKNGKITRRIQMKGFETGYVPNHSNEMSSVFSEGKQGDWMHFYFSFVPNIQRVKETLESNEAILDYSLVLENNSISSWGADYAIDDIRAYVAPPRVEAYQTKPICNSKSETENLQIEVRLPYDALMESLGLAEPEAEAEDVASRYESLQYAILDKELYQNKLKEKMGNDDNYEFSSEDYYEAFVASVLKYPHVHIDSEAAIVEDNKTKSIPWGTIYFDKFYDGNLAWDQANYNGDHSASDGVPKNRAMKHTEDGERNISFITTPPMDPQKRDYIIVIGNFGDKGIFDDTTATDKKNNVTKYPSSGDTKDYDKALAAAFGIGSNCCRMAEFTLNKAAQKVVDGILYGDDDQITCCENQRPVVQLNLYRNDKTAGNIYDEADADHAMLWENPYLDWYAGTYEEFMKEEMDNEAKTSLWEVLADFRTDYPTSTTWDVPASGEVDDDGKQIPTGRTDKDGNPINPASYTLLMKEYLKDLYDEGKLQFYQASYVFPNLVIGNDEKGNKKLYEDFYVTAVPIDSNSELTTEEYIVCTEPTEIKITVSNTSPQMNNGFASGITYPEGMDVVPLRLGLKHTDTSSAAGDKWNLPANTETKDNIILDLSKYEGKEYLVMPLRGLKIATTGVSSFKRVEGDPYCYLAETNDPYYRKLGQVLFKAPAISQNASASGNDQVATQAEPETTGKYDSDFGLVPRGVITVDAKTATDHFSNVKITFNKNEMEFHEGYYYTFKFPYEEDYVGVDLTGIDEESMPCHGETYFTIKVVPEYQVWTGNASLNWNNDDNWKRVTKEQILASSDVPFGKDDSRYTVNSTDTTIHSYAPLDFTKVIIPAGATYPQLAARTHSRTGTGSLSLKNGHLKNGELESVLYIWGATAPTAATEAGSGNESVADATETTPSYLPTYNVQYDMAAATYSDNNNVYCRPWYANACEQIHFNSNAEILNQQNLDYEKAWVDMEMAPHRWYTVASPLYGVVAGDMYLPSVNTDTPGRQMTELFKPIKYDKDLNDRFAPAVYQRGWDKGSETVYTVHNDVKTETESVALASTWSHVYNDVTEEYAPGIGYSVKTDVTRLPKFADSYSQADKQSYVKFRFPKADTSYNYFSDSTQNVGELNHRTLTRTNEGKFYNFEVPKDNNGNVIADKSAGDVILKKATSGNLFLVGNPFMAHLDMKKFFEKNPTLPKKFWIMSESQQLTGVIDEEGNMILNGAVSQNGDKYKEDTKDNDYSLLAPMQGFFVQTAGDPTTSLDIKFTPDMMAVQPYTDPYNKPILKAPAYRTRGDGDDIIRVSTPESTAIIRLSGSAEKGYAASEDVEMIDDSNQRGIRRIYTVAGTMASAINQTPDADGVEVGLMAPADSLTVVTFNGLALEDYLLYDTATGEMTQLYDGFELEMTGSVSGRYFLTAGIDTAEIEDSTIRIMPVGHEAVVTAPAVCGELTVRVFDTLGREVAKAEGFEQEVRIGLEPGVYAVEAIGSDAGRKSAKLQIR